MKVKFQYFGQLGEIAGKTDDEAEIQEGMALDRAIGERAEAYGGAFRRMALDADGRLRLSVMILLNGAMVDRQCPPTLRDGDEVSLLPAIAGG